MPRRVPVVPTITMLDLAGQGLPEVPLLGHYRFRRAEKALSTHSHAGALEICFLARGRQVYRVDDRDHVLRGGEIFVTAPDEAHDTGGKPQEPGELYWMHLRPPAGGGAFLGYDARGGAALASALRHLPSRRVFAAPDGLLGRFEELFERLADQSDPELLRADLAACLGKIVLLLAAAARQDRPSPSSPMNGLLAHIEAHLHEPLSVDQLALRLRLSPSWFKARFKQEVGMPPAEYLARLRVVRAQDLLRTGGQNITNIAHDLGFSSSQYFATVFRRFTGQSPSRLLRKPAYEKGR